MYLQTLQKRKMKTGKIIKKNIKLLLRSKVSTLVLILGPLLIIFLVGISFSTSSFNLRMNSYSDSYSELSNSFIQELENKSYRIIRSDSNESCIQSVREQVSHACLIFPPDLEIENNKVNIVEFYVDQSKINLVYLVMSTLEDSFTDVSTQISEDLTDELVSALFSTKTNLLTADTSITQIQNKNTIIIDTTSSSQNKLNSLDFNAGSGSSTVNTLVEDIKKDLDNLISDSEDLIDDSFNLIDDLEDYDINYKSNESNQDTYDDDIGELSDYITELDDTIKDGYNLSTKKVEKITAQLDDALSDLKNKLNDANSANKDVITKLDSLKTNANELKTESAELQTNIQGMVSNINSIQITNIENIVSPIETRINFVSESSSNLSYLFPSLIVILIMFIGLLLPSTLIIMEKNSKSAFRLFITPTKQSLYILANYLTSLILISLQVFIVLSVSQLYFNIDFFDSFFITMISLLLTMTLFILIGMLIGDLFSTEEMAMLTSVSVATLFLLTSGIVFPIESMPDYVIEKIKFNPVVMGTEAFKQSLIFNSGYGSVKQPLTLLFFSIAFILGLILLSKKLKTQYFRPKKGRINKNQLKKSFGFGDRYAKNLPEFIISVQNLNQEKFQKLLDDKSYFNWVVYILKNKPLAGKIKDKKTKKEILDALVEELKKLQKK